MQRISPLLLVAFTTQAAAQALPNPLQLLNPAALPALGLGNPYGGLAGGLNGLNTLSALGSLGMLAAPVVTSLAPTLLNPMGMGQFGYPGMQLPPNVLPYGQYMQYGGVPYGGNPYLRPSYPNPIAPPGFSPSMPTLPLSPAQGTLPLPFAAPAQNPALPFPGAPASSGGPMPGPVPLPPAAAPAPVLAPPWTPPQASTQYPAPMLPFQNMPTPVPGQWPGAGAPATQTPYLPGPLPPTGMLPGLTPTAPAAPATPQSTPWTQPAAKPATPEAAAPKPETGEGAGPALFDPAAFMQKFLKPVDTTTPPANR